MKPVFETIRQLAKPFMDTRYNDVHTAISNRSDTFSLQGTRTAGLV